MADAYKQGNEPLGSINGGEFLDQFNCYRRLMKNSALIFLLVFIVQACSLLSYLQFETHAVKAEGVRLKRMCNVRITKDFPIINTPYHASEPRVHYPCCNKTL